MIRGANVPIDEVRRYDEHITNRLPADERALYGCRREGQGDFTKSPKRGVQNPLYEP